MGSSLSENSPGRSAIGIHAPGIYMSGDLDLVEASRGSTRTSSLRCAPGARIAAARLAATDFSVGCVCEDETRCHRSILKERLVENGAKLA